MPTALHLNLVYPPGLPDDVSPLGGRVSGALKICIAVMAVTGATLLVYGLTADDTKQLFHSYLFGYVLALDISLGSLFWVLIHHVADAGWSAGLRRVYENLTRAIVPMGFLIIPVLVGIYSGNLHDWYGFVSQPEPEEPHLLHQWHVKHAYFSAPFFAVRIALYFSIWFVYSTALRRWSIKQDALGGSIFTRKMQRWAPSGMLLLGLTSTYFAFDLLMSLQYTWFSTIFGVYFWVGGIRGSLSFAVLLVLAFRASGHLRNTITIEHLHDAAKLMFGFTVFWAYIAFSQYFLIWYGNVPEETQYYLLRRNGAWYEASIALPIVNFAIPFFLLLPRASKRNPIALAFSAGWILLGHGFDLYWQILPVLHRDTIHLHGLDAIAPLFGLSVLSFSATRGMQQSPLIPIRDARLNESIGYENDTP